MNPRPQTFEIKMKQVRMPIPCPEIKANDHQSVLTGSSGLGLKIDVSLLMRVPSLLQQSPSRAPEEI